jgi:adenylate cyclase
MGERKVKNITEPIPVYNVNLNALLPRNAEEQKRPRWAWAAATLTAIVIIVGTWTFLTQQKTASTHRPTIAVLPLVNTSGDPKLGYFSDGMSEGVISMLARSPDLSVVGRSSSFSYKGKGADARQIGKDLGVDYVLEGFFNKEADWVAVAARLIEAKTGEFVWPNRLEKWDADPLVVQDQVTSRYPRYTGWREGETRASNVSHGLGKGHGQSRRVRLLSSWPRPDRN